MTVSGGGGILVGTKIGNVQCMHNSLIICGPVVDTRCSVVCTGIALVGGSGGYMQYCSMPRLDFPWRFWWALE